MKIALVIGTVALLGLWGCAKTSTMALSANEVQIVVDAPPACGPTGAQQVAFRQAAVETIRRGYDSFVIAGVNASDRASGVFHSPGSAQIVGNTVVQSGGFSSIVNRHQNTVIVKMFRASDAASNASAIDARRALGTDWKSAVAESASRVRC